MYLQYAIKSLPCMYICIHIAINKYICMQINSAKMTFLNFCTHNKIAAISIYLLDAF